MNHISCGTKAMDLNIIQVNPIYTNVIVDNCIFNKDREHTWATYPSAVADLWTSFLSVKKLIILEGGIVNCRPKIVSDAWFTGLDLAEFPVKNILKRKTKSKNKKRKNRIWVLKAWQAHCKS